jgi:hypothetical protein
MKSTGELEESLFADLDLNLDLEAITAKKAITSVNVHGVLIPANLLLSRLHIFGQPLVHYTGDDTYQLHLIGSATGFEYKGEKLLICTEHQLKQALGENVGIIVPEKQVFVSSAGYRQVKYNPALHEGDAFDLRVFDFDEQSRVHPELGRRFFKFSSEQILRDDDRVVGYLAYGCPFSDQNYDVYENNRLDTVIRPMLCREHQSLSDDALGACKTRIPMDFDPNGLSGGPVFALVLRNQEFILKFAGIINRASNSIIHFIKARNVQRLLDMPATE